MNTQLLEVYGWTPALEQEFREAADPGDVPGRVLGHERTSLRVITPDGERQVTAGARFRRGRGRDKPVVGDWLLLQPISGDERLNLRRILTRTSSFSRLASSRRNTDGTIGGKPDEQVLSANIDTVFIITGLDDDYSLPRIERYVATIKDGGARPVVLLNKADLVGPEVAAARQAEVRIALPETDVHILSLEENTGLEALDPYLGPGRTIALIGSSGVGKSTLVNSLTGADTALTGETRASDGKGRHTTTWREMFLLPDGRGIMIDNPGLREVGVYSENAAEAFTDIEQLAAQCQFRGCTHESEPNCAVQAAVKRGELSPERLEAYRAVVSEAEQVGDWLRESERRRDRRPRRG